MGISAGILIGFILNLIFSTISKSASSLFVLIYSSSVLPGMVPWFVILIAELKFRKENPKQMAQHTFKLPLYPYSSYFAFSMLFLIIIFMFINPETRLSVIVGAAVLLFATILYFIRKKKIVK